jgi:hypothetical protein
MAKIKHPVSPKEPATGLGTVKRPPNPLPGSNHVPKPGK